MRDDVIHRPPRAMVMEPHTFCNLTCRSCLTGQRRLPRPKGRMPLPSFKRLVDEVAGWLRVVHWSGMGEPLLYDDCLEYLAYLSGAGVHVRVDTNGHRFADRAFTTRFVRTRPAEVNIAFDGVDQASLSAVRGRHADFERLVAGIRCLLEVRDELGSALEVNLQFIACRPNERLLDEALALGRELNPDSMTIKAIRLDPADRRACQALMPHSATHRTYERASGTWRLKGKMRKRCLAIREFCVLLWDGTLVPCCFDLSARYAFGNVFETSFAEAWTSEAAVRFRRRAATDLESIPMCGICPVGRGANNSWEAAL